MNQDPIVLLLVGRTGNGKSSTGNSILRNKLFTSHGVVEQNLVENPVKHIDGLIIVVDGSGIGDTGEDLIGGISAAIKSCNQAFELCGKIFTAIILVLKFGVRFTKQEKDAVRMIKFLFGEDVLKRWGIIVMTYGDNFKEGDFEKDEFEMDNLEEDKTEPFKSWCNKQGGDFKSVYEECNKRCVLFNNRTSDTEQMENQVLAVLRGVQKLKFGPYTQVDFNDAVKNRPKLYPPNFQEKQRDDTIEDLMINAELFIEDGIGDYNQLSADLKKTKLQEKREKAFHRISVLFEQPRMIQRMWESLCAYMNLVYVSVHKKSRGIFSWLRSKLRRGDRVEPLQSFSDS